MRGSGRRCSSGSQAETASSGDRKQRRIKSAEDAQPPPPVRCRLSGTPDDFLDYAGRGPDAPAKPVHFPLTEQMASIEAGDRRPPSHPCLFALMTHRSRRPRLPGGRLLVHLRGYFQSINPDAKYSYRSDGLQPGAIRLFSAKLYQFILDGAVGIGPTHPCRSSSPRPVDTFRKDIYEDYKGTRRDPPDDLKPQLP